MRCSGLALSQKRLTIDCIGNDKSMKITLIASITLPLRLLLYENFICYIKRISGRNFEKYISYIPDSLVSESLLNYNRVPLHNYTLCVKLEILVEIHLREFR